MSRIILAVLDTDPFVDCRCEAGCDECFGTGRIPVDLTPLLNLVHCLVVAGALTTAWEQGWLARVDEVAGCTDAWRPNVDGNPLMVVSYGVGKYPAVAALTGERRR